MNSPCQTATSNPATPFLSDRAKGFLAASGVVLCWSGFNIVSRYGSTGTFTPYDLAALRFGVSGFLAWPFFFRLARSEDWLKYVVLALLGGIGYGVLVYSGFAHAPTAHAAIFVNGGIPFWTVLILTALAGFRIPRGVLVALLISLSGIALIAWESLFVVRSSGQWLGDLLFIAAALTWAVFGILMRRWKIQPTLAITGVAVISLGLYLPVYALFLPKAIATAPAGAIALQCLYQGFIAALCAGWMYSYANHKIGSGPASMMLALVPGLSALGGALLLGESLGLTAMLGILIVSGGAILGALANRQG